MAEFLTRTQKALAHAAQAVNDTATEGESQDRLLAVGSFALDHGLVEANGGARSNPKSLWRSRTDKDVGGADASGGPSLAMARPLRHLLAGR